MNLDPSQYGIFANIVAIAGMLIATFGVLLLNNMGRLSQWTWLIHNAPTFLVGAGARALAVAVMAITYITINKFNYLYFGGFAVVCGAANLYFINKFNLLRQIHIVKVPLVGRNGKQQKDKKGRPLFSNVVIGTANNMSPVANQDYRMAQRKSGGLSLLNFMGGYGNPVNNPQSIWSNQTLAQISSELTLTLMYIALCSVLTLYLASFSIDVHLRQ